MKKEKSITQALMDYAFEKNNSSRDDEWCELVLSSEDSGAKKEELSLHFLGYDKVPGKHGFDGKCKKTGLYVEVKSERTTVNGNSGHWAYGNNTAKTFESKIEKDTIQVQSTFTRSGRLIAMLRYNTFDSEIPKMIKEFLSKKKKEKDNKTETKTNFKGTHTSFKNAKSLEVLYYNPKYSDELTSTYKKLIEDTLKANKIKELEEMSDEDLDELWSKNEREDKISFLAKKQVALDNAIRA